MMAFQRKQKAGEAKYLLRLLFNQPRMSKEFVAREWGAERMVYFIKSYVLFLTAQLIT